MFNIKICILFACTFIQISCYESMWDSTDSSPFVKIGEKYYFIAANEKANWFEAAHFCRSIDADLANIESQEEMNAVSNYLLSKAYKGRKFYISLNDLGKEGSFYSIATGQPIDFAKWSPGQPDNAGGNENCVHLWIQGGQYTMNVCPCSLQHQYICQIENPTY